MSETATAEVPAAPAAIPPAAVPAAPAAPVAIPAEPAKPADPAKTVLTDAPKAERVVPEKYDIKLPDGSLVTPDDLKKLEPLKLTNDEAQAVVDQMNAKVASYVEQQETKVKELMTSWVTQAKADKEIGGEAFAKNAELAKRVVDRFATPELKAELNKGWGNNPELIRLLYRIGKSMAEDTLVIPGTPTSAAKDPQAVMVSKFYPKPAE